MRYRLRTLLILLAILPPLLACAWWGWSEWQARRAAAAQRAAAQREQVISFYLGLLGDSGADPLMCFRPRRPTVHADSGGLSAAAARCGK